MNRTRQGFTLVELAVVLAIIGFVLGALVVPLSTQYDQQRASQTQRQLEVVREALLGFAVANGRLPCPATSTTPNTTAGAGTESRSGGACTGVSGGAAEGVVPWATLGIEETDGWQRRFTYRVTAAFADDPAGGAQATFALTDNGNATITNGPVNIATGVPVVIVSHGKNGSGAYRQDGVREALSTGDELENHNADATFVSRLPSPDYDDLLVWIPASILKSRMVAANRLP